MFPQITVSGAPHARGQQYGAQAAHQIRHSIASYARLFAYLRGMTWGEAQQEALRYVPVIAQHAPDLLDEMRGIAEGAALAFASILALNVRTELVAGVRRQAAHPGYGAALADNQRADVPQHGECTTVAAFPQATAAGRTLLAQTWDWYGDQRAACVVLQVESPGEPTILTVTEAGMLAKIGLNSAGLGVSLNILFTDMDGQEPGMPVHVQLRRMLQQRSVAAATALAQGVRAGASSCITVADSSGAGASLEITPGHVAVVAPHHGLLVHTNHCVAATGDAHEQPLLATSGSMPRFARGHALLEAAHGQIDRETLVAALRDHENAPTCICRHADPSLAADYQVESVTGIVMDVGAGVMLVAAGVPCAVPFEEIAVLAHMS